MKVLMVTESYWPNTDGGAQFERRLALGLVERGHQVNVWAAGPKFKSFTEVDGPYRIFRERGVTFWANRKYKVSFMPFWHARQIIRRTRPEVIHIHNCYFMGLSAMFWAKRYRIPVVATNHFMPENALLNLSLPSLLNGPSERIIWSFLVWFHNRAAFVTSPTPTAVKLLQDNGLHVPAEAITNGIDMAVFKPGSPDHALAKRLGIPTDRPMVLYVGRVDGEKRLDILLNAIPSLLKKHQSVLIIAGYGKDMDNLVAQAKELGITGDVIFTGFLPEADKPALYRLATIFAITSPAELQSIVTLEAMASGLPIVATDVAALKELCHDGHNGYLFSQNNVPELTEALSKLLDNKTTRDQFGAESVRIIAKSHSTDITFESYERVYHLATAGVS